MIGTNTDDFEKNTPRRAPRRARSRPRPALLTTRDRARLAEQRRLDEARNPDPPPRQRFPKGLEQGVLFCVCKVGSKRCSACLKFAAVARAASPFTGRGRP